MKSEGYERVASRPVSVEETIAGYEQHYSIEEQSQFGVLAIEIELLKHQSTA